MTALYETALSKRRIRSICKQKKDRVIENKKKLDRTYRYVAIREIARKALTVVSSARRADVAVVKSVVLCLQRVERRVHTEWSEWCNAAMQAGFYRSETSRVSEKTKEGGKRQSCCNRR